MSDVNFRLKIISCETNQDSITEYRQPQRYTEGASFRQDSDYFPNERSNTVSDIPSNIRRSLSDDFQDSFEIFNVHEIMSHPGGTNSLPAFLTGRPGERNHSALLQQAQCSRAVENDYCENPSPQGIHSRTRGHSRNTRAATGSNDHRRQRHRHHQDSNGARHHTRSSNRRHCNREEGTQVGFHGTVSTSVSSHASLRGNQDFDTPPPRPPLSKYHIEHRYVGRSLRASSSLPASFSVKSGDELLVPMRNNPVPSYRPRFERNERHRDGGSSTRAHIERLRGYSLTPPPICRANKPRYDSNNRIIQTVSSPSVVTQCVDSSTIHSWRSQNQWPVLPASGKSHAKAKRCSNLALSQPTHVVISQQPKSRSKKKLDDDDEIARQKKGLVVNMNNNIARTTQASSEEKMPKKKKSKSAKSYESKDGKKHEFEKLVPADASADDGADLNQLSSTEITPLKFGERCPRCGKCSESDRGDKKTECLQNPPDVISQQPKSRSKKKLDNDDEIARQKKGLVVNMNNNSDRGDKKTECLENPPDNRCDSAVDTCVETATCFCCVKGLFYHGLSHEDEETFAEKPCSCQSEKCCLRWSIMGILSLCLPCLCCYPLARGAVKLCRGGCGCVKSGCQCKEPYS